jgi:hypothetical protein
VTSKTKKYFQYSKTAMSFSAELFESKDPKRLISALRRTTLYDVHDKRAIVHVPAEVLAVLAKVYDGKKPKTYEELEEKDAKKKKLIRYAAKLDAKITDFVNGQCLAGFGCNAEGKAEEVIRGLLRKSEALEILLINNEVASVVGYGRAGTGKFGRKLVLQDEPIAKKVKKDKVYTAYKGRKLFEIDVLAGRDEKFEDAKTLLNYVIAHRLAGHSSGVLIQVLQDTPIGEWVSAFGFETVYAHLKKDGEYRQLRLPQGVEYMALVDTPQREGQKKVSWITKFGRAYDVDVELCPARGARDAWRQPCTF